MELYQLKTFIVAAEEGQITKAARRLHITQPAVSAQIKSLEGAVGLPLFERTGAGIVLTPAGSELLEEARIVIAASKAFALRSRKLREELCQELRLGTIMHPRFIRLGPLILQMMELYPLLRIKLQHGFSDGVVENLKSGELDAAFLLGSEMVEGVSYIELARLRYTVVGPKKWNKEIEKASLADLAKLPWLVAPPGTSQALLLGRLFPDPRLQPMKVVEVDQEATMVSLVMEEVGLCLMRKELADDFAKAGRVSLWQGEGPGAILSFAYETARQHDAALAATIETISSIWQNAKLRSSVDELDIAAS